MVETVSLEWVSETDVFHAEPGCGSSRSTARTDLVEASPMRSRHRCWVGQLAPNELDVAALVFHERPADVDSSTSAAP